MTELCQRYRDVGLRTSDMCGQFVGLQKPLAARGGKPQKNLAEAGYA
jgi:hypothetical protein